MSGASKTQSIVACSSREAELLSICSAVAEAIFVQGIHKDFFGDLLPIVVYTDSVACLGMIGKTGVGRVQHLDTRFLWLQQLVCEKRLTLDHVPSAENEADIYTKQLYPQKLQEACEKLGLF